MKKGTKIALGIGIPVLFGVTYLMMRNRAKKKGCSKTKFGASIFGVVLCPDNEIISGEVVRGEEDRATINPSSSSSSGSGSRPSPSGRFTVFKSASEGNSFRLWVNYKHNEYAKKINLDSVGSHTNAFIQKAWAKYGAEYQKANPLRMVKALMGKNVKFENNEITAGFDNGKRIKFFDNGRYYAYDNAGKVIQKGNYYSGGRDLVPSALINKGKQFKNGSVWLNILNATK